MKRFYRQRKSTTNKSSSKSRKKSKVVEKCPDYSSEEHVLRMFDMNMKYGPCLGLTRLQRWERAHKMSLNPPEQIKCLLEGDKAQLKCLWHKLSIHGGTLTIKETREGTSFIERIDY
ncbi:hypothetical protein GLYMA_15G135000v4 [Glycine max]|nr:hypothetical protein GLYMA_15G135000v4 [Glycine max]KAH1147007.1 hypothetical protein GYH30_042263 [Glycine max]